MSLAGAIMLATGALEMAIGLFLYFRTRRFLETAVDAQGTVTGFEEHYDSDSGTTYSPIVEFTGAEGGTRRFTDSMSSSPPGYDVGEAVPIKYDPSNPEKARIAKRFRLWFVPMLLGSTGALFAIIGAILLALA